MIRKSIRPIGRKPVLSMRIRKPLYEAIRAAAAENGRTISDETQWRLELSFYNKEIRSDLADREMERWAS